MRISKKVLSVFLAMVMVVTTLPSFAFNALAADATGSSNTVKAPVSSNMILLYDQMQKFEERISSGKIYTNYLPAYSAYINACKLYYACDPHDQNSGLTNAYNELLAAMNSMNEWGKSLYAKAVPTSYPSFSNDTTSWDSGAKNYYSNVLWGESGTSASRASYGASSVTADIYYPQTVLLYDGLNDLSFGILLKMQGTSSSATNSNRYIFSAALNNDDAVLLKNWTGTGDGSNLDYTYHAASKTQQISYSSTEMTSGSSSVQIRKKGTFSGTSYTRYFANQIHFDDIDNPMGTSEYLREIYPSVTTYCGSEASQSNWNSDVINTVAGNSPVYIINYKAVTDAIDLVTLNYDVKDYQFGGLSDVFAAIDRATAFNPNNYDYAEDLSKAVSECEKEIREICEDLNNLNDLTGYQDTELLDPTSDLESYGDAVHMDGIIYTHLAGNAYSMYGQEISDDYLYGTDQLNQGERYTAVSVDYPCYIDTKNPMSIYSLSDADIVKEGYSYGDIRAQELYDGKWVDEEGTTYDTDDAAAAAVNAGHSVTKEYYLVGNVSNYFCYNEETGEYTRTGVELAVVYRDIDGNQYGEYQFPYVMPNPAIAHTLVGMRNTHNGGVGTDARAAALVYTRFNGSSGSATDIVSDITKSAKTDADSDAYTAEGTTEPVLGTGSFNYLGAFGSDESLGYSYTTPDLIAKSFTFYDKKTGVNAGSYGSAEHSNHKDYAYTMTSAVVDVDYYIDYSDKSSDLITYDSNGIPSGYSFDFIVSNLNWNPKQDRGNAKSATAYYRNSTGLAAKSTLLAYDSSNSVSYDATFNNWSNAETLGYGDENYGRKVMSGYYDDEENYSDTTYKTGLQYAFDYVDTGWSATNAWQGMITFTGKDSVSKNTDASSAEKYANFVFEKGSYEGQGSASWTPSYWGGEEVYSYYNIGVNTCDKGAVREFVETFTNQMIDIKYTDDTKTEIANLTAAGEIESGKYSVSSYRAYLDAIADAYWFIENDQNTTYYTDSEGNLVNRDDENTDLDTSDLTEHEFTTAYAVIGDGTKHSLLYSDQVGNDIFGTGETSTDPVQAQIIQHILEAYENLFTLEDYNTDNDTYNAVIEKYYDVNTDDETGEITRTLKTSVDEDMTESAKNTLNTIVAIGDAAFGYQTDTLGVDDYWRYVKLDGEDYKNLTTALQTLLNGLMPAVDEDALLTEIDTKKTVLDNSKCTTDSSGNIVQTTSYSSWKTLNAAVSGAVTAAEENKGKNKLVATETLTLTIDGVDYTVDVVPEDISDNYSEYQIAVNDKYTDIKDRVVSSVDEDSSYEAFNNAMKVVKTLDRDKYTDEGIAQLDALAERLTTADVYTTLTGDAAAAFGVDADTQIKVTNLTETDPYTAELLNLITTLNETYVKQFRAEFTVQYGDDENTAVDGEPQKLYYGDTFAFDVESLVGSLAEDDVVIWSASLYDGLEDAEFNSDTLKGSQKVLGYDGAELSRIADTNVKVCASIVKGETSNAAYKIEVRNVYGRVVKIVYADEKPATTTDQTITIGDTDVTAETVPFYTFNYWAVSEPDENNVISVTARYTVEDNYSFTVTDGSIVSGAAIAGENTDNQTVYNAAFDKLLTIRPNENVTDFYGWAIKTADGKYQIASYNEEYSFYACADESFVPIIAVTENNVTTYTVDGKVLTAEMLDSSTTIELKDTADDDQAKASADEFVQNKLAQKLPFIAIQDTVMKSGNTKITAFVRVTEGCDTASISSYGMLYKIGASDAANMICENAGKGVYKVAVNNMLSTGQYVVTLNSKSAVSADITFRAYINYNYDYSFSHTNNEEVSDVNTKVNVLDYSNVGIAQPQNN